MKLSELEEGTIYKCSISGKKMLVISSTKTIPSEIEGDAPTEIIVKAGKYVNVLDSGSVSFMYDELFEGQLEAIND